MSPLRPKLLLDLLSQSLPSSRKLSFPKAGRVRYHSVLKAACFSVMMGGLALHAKPAKAATFDWATQGWEANNVAPVLNGGTANPYTLNGVTLNFQWTPDGGATFIEFPFGTNFTPNVTGVGGTGLTGGLGPNLIANFDSTAVTDHLDFAVTFTNAAGDVVPVRNLTYTIIDIDRDDAQGWQDVVSAAASFGGIANPVTGTFNINDANGTVDQIDAAEAAAGALTYVPPTGALSFRGRTDADVTGEAEANNVEANNQRNEGSVTLDYSSFVDRIDLTYGNGPVAQAANGLPFDLPADPESHAVGFFGGFNFEPAIVGIAKHGTAPVLQTTGANAGKFLVTFTLRVTNPGEVPLANVQVQDDLVAAFGSAANFSVVPGSITGTAGGDQSFNGGDTTDVNGGALTANTQLVLDGGNLAPAESRDITFDVLIEPGAGSGPFSNQATVLANPVDGNGAVATNVIVQDRSSNANSVANLNVDADEDDPDDTVNNGPGTTFTSASGTPNVVRVDGDNDPSNNDSPTVIAIPTAPRIGVTKQVIDVTPVGGGQFDVTYRHIVQNVGTIPLTGVQLNENLTTTFRQGAADGVTDYAVTGIRIPTAGDATNPNPFDTGGAAQNPNYVVLSAGPAPGGTNFGNFNYLTGADGLQPGQFGVVDFVTRVTPGANLGDGPAPDVPFEGQVTATGTGNDVGNTVVTDLSDDVTEFINDPANQFPQDLNGDFDTTDPDAEADPAANIGAATTPASSAGRNLLDPALADPDGASENDRTPVAFLPPQIGVTKQVSNISSNPDGTYTITYRQIVRNLGNEPIGGVALTENDTVANTFRQGDPTGTTSAAFVPGSLTVPGAAPAGFPAGYVPLTGTPAFDGAGNLELATVPTLPVGGYGIVDYQVIVDPTDPLDPTIENLGDGATSGAADDTAYIAQATVTGTGANSGLPTSDLSDDSSNFNPGTTVPSGTPLPVAQQLPRDETGNLTATDGAAGPGTPGGPENDPSPLSLAPLPQIGLTKQVTNIIDNGDGSFDVVFDYVVQNQGQVPLNGLTISDNYDDQFNANDIGPVANYQVISVTPGASTASAPLTAEPTAPGQTQGSGLIPLANGTTTVYQPGQQSTAQVVVRVFNPDLSAVYDSNALANGVSTVDGSPTTDLSDNVPQFGAPGPEDGIFGPGSAPGDPNDPANTQTSILFSPLQLFKRITSITRSGVTTNFTNVVGTVPDPSFVGEVDIRNLEDLQIGDSAEYTIYYFNASGAAINNVELCDPVPSPLTIINGSLTATPAATGTIISPLTPLSPTSNPGRSCGASSGTQGAAVFDVGDIAPASGGFVRFSNLIQ